MSEDAPDPQPDALPFGPGAGATPLLANPVFQKDPYALYAMLRISQPVFRPPIPVDVGAGVFVLTRHRDVEAALRDGTLAFARNPGEWARLRAQPELLENAVEELLRFDSPVQATVRVATEPFALGEDTIPPAALVVCGIGAANREPEIHPDPDRLDITRDDIRHLSFGHGTHFCLGASLARLEGRAVFAAMSRRYESMELACDEEQLAYRPNPILRGLQRLPVRALS